MKKVFCFFISMFWATVCLGADVLENKGEHRAVALASAMSLGSQNIERHERASRALHLQIGKKAKADDRFPLGDNVVAELTEKRLEISDVQNGFSVVGSRETPDSFVYRISIKDSIYTCNGVAEFEVGLSEINTADKLRDFIKMLGIYLSQPESMRMLAAPPSSGFIKAVVNETGLEARLSYGWFTVQSNVGNVRGKKIGDHYAYEIILYSGQERRKMYVDGNAQFEVEEENINTSDTFKFFVRGLYQCMQEHLAGIAVKTLPLLRPPEKLLEISVDGLTGVLTNKSFTVKGTVADLDIDVFGVKRDDCFVFDINIHGLHGKVSGNGMPFKLPVDGIYAVKARDINTEAGFREFVQLKRARVFSVPQALLIVINRLDLTALLTCSRMEFTDTRDGCTVTLNGVRQGDRYACYVFLANDSDNSFVLQAPVAGGEAKPMKFMVSASVVDNQNIFEKFINNVREGLGDPRAVPGFTKTSPLARWALDRPLPYLDDESFFEQAFSLEAKEKVEKKGDPVIPAVTRLKLNPFEHQTKSAKFWGNDDKFGIEDEYPSIRVVVDGTRFEDAGVSLFRYTIKFVCGTQEVYLQRSPDGRSQAPATFLLDNLLLSNPKRFPELLTDFYQNKVCRHLEKLFPDLVGADVQEKWRPKPPIYHISRDHDFNQPLISISQVPHDQIRVVPADDFLFVELPNGVPEPRETSPGLWSWVNIGVGVAANSWQRVRSLFSLGT